MMPSPEPKVTRNIYKLWGTPGLLLKFNHWSFSSQASFFFGPAAEFYTLEIYLPKVPKKLTYGNIWKWTQEIQAGVNKKPFACPFQDRQFQNLERL